MKRFDHVALGACLRGRRKMRGATLRQAGESIGISAATVQRIESGEPMEIDSAVAVADWLELPLDAFVREVEVLNVK